MKVNPRNASSLSICPACFEVCGTVSIEGVEYRQRCSCRPPGEPDSVSYPPGYDYATYIEICRACGVEAISSGSKWSQFFCPQCHGAIRGLNRSLGFAVIPIGRHSLMNSFSLTSAEVEEPEKVAEFVRKVQDCSARSAKLDDWRRLMVAARCTEFGIRGDERIPLGLFMRRAKKADCVMIKKKSIRQLFSFFEIPETLTRLTESN